MDLLEFVALISGCWAVHRESIFIRCGFSFLFIWCYHHFLVCLSSHALFCISTRVASPWGVHDVWSMGMSHAMACAMSCGKFCHMAPFPWPCLMALSLCRSTVPWPCPVFEWTGTLFPWVRGLQCIACRRLFVCCSCNAC